MHNMRFSLEGFPSGQRDQTVNLTALPSKVRILPPPPKYTLMQLGGIKTLLLCEQGKSLVQLIGFELCEKAGVAQW